jgi:hypothetical protein
MEHEQGSLPINTDDTDRGLSRARLRVDRARDRGHIKDREDDCALPNRRNYEKREGLKKTKDGGRSRVITAKR